VDLTRGSGALNLATEGAVTRTAFGELNEELDDRVVERAEAILGRTLTGAERFTESTRYRYNTLGKLVSRTEAAANVTTENGFASRVRAVTSLGYDLLGRLNTQTDPNGNRTLQGLMAGSADAVVSRYSVDGDRHIDYNDFGEVMRVADEADNKTTTVHDQLGRVTKVTRGGVHNGVRSCLLPMRFPIRTHAPPDRWRPEKPA
jgi:YD repeat-containing protein